MNENIPKNPIQFGVYTSKPHVKWVVLAFTSVFIATGLDRFNVVILQNLTNSIAAPQIVFGTVWFWALTYPVLSFIAQNIWRASGFSGMRWFMGIQATGYQKLYQYLSFHSKDYFNNRFAGALASKITNAVDGIDDFFERFLWQFLPVLIGIFWYTIFTALSFWALGAIIVIWTIIFLLTNAWFAGKLQPRSYKSAEAVSTLKGKVVDSLSNISLVHEHAYLTGESEYINKFIKRMRDAGLSSWNFSEWVLFANGIMIFIFMFLMVCSSIYLFQNKLISIGVVVMVVAIVADLRGQLFFLAQQIRDSARLYGQVEEGLNEILKEHAIVDSAHSSDLKLSHGAVSFESIDFEYENTKVFSNFSIEIPAGQKVGLVGRSGAGKTTFVSLLLRHFDIQNGSIKIDGQNIRDITLNSLRRSIALVPQDVSLFHRTISENISYSNPGATVDEIKKAAKAAQADDFINKLPNKYETLVGERGVKLSGGQKQRIAIARAFLKNAPIIVLDEATSSLDSESEQIIQVSLERLMQKRTVIAIAHRLSTLKEMDRLVVIDDGYVVEDGSPEDLLKKKNGIFKNMWDHQVKGFIVDE